MSAGKVYLVGAGPGDPGLLTVTAARVLGRADVVVYDHLVADAILDRLPTTVERVYAGKEAGLHTMNQDVINAILEERARRGQIVVRLKGGDPFVFGRGGEEAEYLAERGIPFEVVPGVSSVFAVPAFAGIPVTHRTMAASVAVVTARAGPAGELPSIDWERLAGADTMIILMGVASLDHVVRVLVDNGRAAMTPVAAIRWGSTAQQRTIVGTLETIAARVREAELRAPAILVVGGVVSLMDRIGWVGRRPLFGRRILLPVTYPSPLTEPLERHGAEVLHAPPVEAEPPISWDELDRALARLDSYAGVVFADETAVVALFERLGAHGGDARALAHHQVIADGHWTRTLLAQRSIRADRVIEQWNGNTAFAPAPETGPWLVVGSPDSQAEVASALAGQGVRADTPAVCRLATPKWRADRLRELLTTRPVDAIAFPHRYQVRRVLAALDPDERRSIAGVCLVSSGPSVTQALRDGGLAPALVVDDPSPETLAETLAIALTVTRRGAA